MLVTINGYWQTNKRKESGLNKKREIFISWMNRKIFREKLLAFQTRTSFWKVITVLSNQEKVYGLAINLILCFINDKLLRHRRYLKSRSKHRSETACLLISWIVNVECVLCCECLKAWGPQLNKYKMSWVDPLDISFPVNLAMIIVKTWTVALALCLGNKKIMFAKIKVRIIIVTDLLMSWT